MLNGWSPSRKLAGVVLLLVVVVAGIAAASRSGDGDAAASRAAASTSADGTGGTTGSTTKDGAATTGGDDGSTADAPQGTTPPAPLPLEAKVVGTTGLHDGDDVTVTVDADPGSQVFGVEMRMCKAGTVVRNDGDMLPSVTGNCASKPLAPGADGYKIVPGKAPFSSVTATYKVGVGTDTFQMDDASMTSVTCDHDHPCVLAVKYQIPDGFGFRTYPLTFS